MFTQEGSSTIYELKTRITTMLIIHLQYKMLAEILTAVFSSRDSGNIAIVI